MNASFKENQYTSDIIVIRNKEINMGLLTTIQQNSH